MKKNTKRNTENSVSVVGTKLLRSEVKRAAEIRKKYEVEDARLVDDTYRLFKCRGTRLYTAQRCDKLYRKLPYVERTTLLMRRKFLAQVVKLPVFRKMCLGRTDTGELVDRFFALLRTAYKKHTETACHSCEHLTMCAFGAYHVNSRGQVNGNLARHASCPLQQQGIAVPGSAASLGMGVTLVLALLHAAYAGISNLPKEIRHEYDTTFTGAAVLDKLQKAVEDLAGKQLHVFNLSRCLDESITKGKSRKTVTSQVPDRHLSVERMQSYADIPRLDKSSLAMPSALQTYRLGMKQHSIVEQRKSEEKKQGLLVLLDTSYSMRDPVSTGRYGFMCKGDVATALILATIKKVMEEKGKMYLRCFAGGVDSLQKALVEDDFVAMSTKLALCNFNGSSTVIQAAIHTAFTDIEKERGLLSKAEVLLITDAEDEAIDADSLLKSRKSTKLHTLEILKDCKQGSQKGRAALRSLSETYVEIDSATMNIDNVVKVVPTTK